MFWLHLQAKEKSADFQTQASLPHETKQLKFVIGNFTL